MTSISGYTVSELMEKTGKSRSAVESWISLHKVKPIINEFLYPPETLERLLAAKRGRPKNPDIVKVEASHTAFVEALKIDASSRKALEKGKAHKKSLIQLRKTFKETFQKVVHAPSPEAIKAFEELISDLNESEIINLMAEVVDRLKKTDPAPPPPKPKKPKK